MKILKSTLLVGLSTLLSPPETVSQNRPNILCIVCEDISPYLRCYGDPLAKTPNLDRLASEGIRFTRMFTTVGVCAPSRAALITGMYPTAIGANHMRNFAPGAKASKYFPEGISSYEVVLPVPVKCYTEYLRAAGYYCTNNSKTDYQFAPPLSAWDENGKSAHWKNRTEGKPFFSIFNLEVTHESKIWERNSEPLIVDPWKIPLPPYFPDDPVVRHDFAILYGNIHEMDKQVQNLIEEVKKAGLFDNTIIIFYSDNGGPFPLQKREVNERGTLVPFIIRFPDGSRKNEVEKQLCSFVDIPATILSLADIKPPRSMHGRAFLGKYRAKPRQYVFGGRNRMDEQIDKQGFVRDRKYRYIRNYYSEKQGYMPIAYRLQMPMMKKILELHEEGNLNEVQERWFKAPRPVEEFYDVENDPHEVNNLINNKAFFTEIERLRKAYTRWDRSHNKLWQLTEAECREYFWPHNQQPTVKDPVFRETDNGLMIKTETRGASMAYQTNAQNNKNRWNLYTGPIKNKKGDTITVVAVRAGYKNSKKVVFPDSNDKKRVQNGDK